MPETGRTTKFDKFAWHKAYGEQHDVKYEERGVAYIMFDHSHEDGTEARPGVDLLTAKTGLSERTIRRHLTANVDAGWLVLVSKGSNSGRAAKKSVYRLAYPKVHRTQVTTDQTGTPDTGDQNTGHPRPGTPDTGGPLTDPGTYPITTPTDRLAELRAKATGELTATEREELRGAGYSYAPMLDKWIRGHPGHDVTPKPKPMPKFVNDHHRTIATERKISEVDLARLANVSASKYSPVNYLTKVLEGTSASPRLIAGGLWQGD
ncbi:hypothetical protein CH247_11070 [Rhodococcus sp. 06-156-3b]|nr:helix-turn-helix domain-containing protein [Rhodococcus sp. 06-156-3b]OZD31699.1 hypothetical protein CH247_11070 [Rhodococcus sp. 06-156-3b]